MSGWKEADRIAHGKDEEWDKRFKKAMAYAKHSSLRLTPQERYELAKMVPGVDSNGTGSWKALTREQLDSLLNMLEGWVYVTKIIMDREEI